MYHLQRSLRNAASHTTDYNESKIVSGSSKIQTLCHMTQVLLKLRFTAMETLSVY